MRQSKILDTVENVIVFERTKNKINNDFKEIKIGMN